MAIIKAKITRCDNPKMEGHELWRLRKEAGLTQEELAKKMFGWGWYRDKIVRLESEAEFELEPQEMTALLEALNASLI
jgi:transcriptional regulator with XRE-family HTH domain